MEESEGEVDALHRHVAIAFVRATFEGHIVESQMFKFPECPGCQHDPGKDGVEQENDGICYTCCHAAMQSVCCLRLYARCDSPALKLAACIA